MITNREMFSIFIPIRLQTLTMLWKTHHGRPRDDEEETKGKGQGLSIGGGGGVKFTISIRKTMLTGAPIEGSLQSVQYLVGLWKKLFPVFMQCVFLRPCGYDHQPEVCKDKSGWV